MSELRQRKSTNPLDSFRELDAFKMNKLPEEIEQKSNIGKCHKKYYRISINSLLIINYFRWHSVNSIKIINNSSDL